MFERVSRLVREALEAMVDIVESFSLDEFLEITRLRFALRYAVIQFWEVVCDAHYIIFEKHYKTLPSSLREGIDKAH